MYIKNNQKLKKYIKIPILYYLMIAIHEVGHLIGIILFSEMKIVRFDYTLYSFEIIVRGMPTSTLASLLILLLIIPITLEFGFLYKVKSNKIWYIASLLIHRMDIWYLLNRVVM